MHASVNVKHHERGAWSRTVRLPVFFLDLSIRMLYSIGPNVFLHVLRRPLIDYLAHSLHQVTQLHKGFASITDSTTHGAFSDTDCPRDVCSRVRLSTLTR
jgi:hypothetical protein